MSLVGVHTRDAARVELVETAAVCIPADPPHDRLMTTDVNAKVA